MENIPEEVLSLIMSHFRAIDVHRTLSVVSKTWRRVALSNDVWLHIYIDLDEMSCDVAIYLLRNVPVAALINRTLHFDKVSEVEPHLKRFDGRLKRLALPGNCTVLLLSTALRNKSVLRQLRVVLGQMCSSPLSINGSIMTVIDVFKCISHLTVLDVVIKEGFRPAFLAECSLSGNFLPRLRKLKSHNTSFLASEDPFTTFIIMNTHSTLRSLEVSYEDRTSSYTCVLNAASQIKMLCQLSIPFEDVKIVSNFQQLKEVTVVIKEDITHEVRSATVRYFEGSNDCPQVTSFAVIADNAMDLTNVSSVLMSLAKALPKVKNLFISGNAFKVPSITTMLNTWTDLEYLSIQGSCFQLPILELIVKQNKLVEVSGEVHCSSSDATKANKILLEHFSCKTQKILVFDIDLQSYVLGSEM